MTALDEDDMQTEDLLSGLVEIRITTRDPKEARFLARMLVQRRLVAGANVLLGVESVYRWKGDVCEHGECLILAQTVSRRFADLQEAVSAVHTYETPMITAVPLAAASPDFARWVREQTAPESPTPTPFEES